MDANTKALKSAVSELILITKELRWLVEQGTEMRMLIDISIDNAEQYLRDVTTLRKVKATGKRKPKAKGKRGLRSKAQRKYLFG